MNTARMETPATRARPIRHIPWCARHLHWLMQDLTGVARQPEQDHRTHLRATLKWVCRASWRDAAWCALAWIKRNQRTKGDDLALRDALPSAVPIWSGPAACGFETLNAKYFADALMMDMVGISIPPEAPGVNHT